MTTRRYAIVSALASATGLSIGFARPAGAQTDNAIVLGQSAPLTGPAAQLGIQFREGAKLYFNQVNAKGGINAPD